jgi:hypothetical protein
LRALKVIPQAASELPTNVSSIDWPSQLITAATKGTQAVTTQKDNLGYSVAYFTTASGSKTRSKKSAAHLYINLPTPNGPYAQEIQKQPSWLNSAEGIINILRGCLGDYSQLIGKGILQSCTESILCKALGLTCPQTAGSNLVTCEDQLAAINKTQQQYIANLSGQQIPPQQSTSQTGTGGNSYLSGTSTYLPPIGGVTQTGTQTPPAQQSTSETSTSSGSYLSSIGSYLPPAGGTTSTNTGTQS